MESNAIRNASVNIGNLWAKSAKDEGGPWHPLLLHMLDVAASAEAVLAREPETSRRIAGAGFGLEWKDARNLFLFLIASHDIGKACPGFQCKWPMILVATGLTVPASPNMRIRHGFVSRLALSKDLISLGWPQEIADLSSEAVGCHHGVRADPVTLYDLEGDRRGIGGDDWATARGMIMERVRRVFPQTKIPVKDTLSGPDFMFLSGLTSFSDWIGSNEEFFPYGTIADCADPEEWYKKSGRKAERALDAIGWGARVALAKEHRTFKQVFDLSPRPLQKSMITALKRLDGPALLLLEAPMGEGKTEAALYAHLELQRRFGHRGLYIALPTKATGDAMFLRVLEFLQKQKGESNLDLQLLHGAAFLNDSFMNLRISGIYDQENRSEIRAGEWFTHKKRALLSEYGVGTIDQALLSILPVKHYFVRMWGLANRVVVFDEIHAYDAYTGTLLLCLIRWLLCLGASVILLSATLPPTFRRKLADIVGASLPECEKYPRLSIYQEGHVEQMTFPADSTRRNVLQLSGIPADIDGLFSAIDEHMAGPGSYLAIVNTVQRAQDLYRMFPAGEMIEYKGQIVGKIIANSTEIYLFHARYPAGERQLREESVLEIFGKNGPRGGRRILIATQVVEQSLDLDFDDMITDLAPIDLILQRAGRLWRHHRNDRHVDTPLLFIAGLQGEVPQSFDNPLWWSAVYREDILLRTWCLLKGREELILPDEIDGLVKDVYEERTNIPEQIKNRLEKAMVNAEGEALSKRGQANVAVIGFPDDRSWDQPDKFVPYDEDEPRIHRTLVAHTRLGDDNMNIIPVKKEQLCPGNKIDINDSRILFMRTIPISRRRVINKLRSSGVPECWQDSVLLRNCYPLILDAGNRWVEDGGVFLDEELGLVYESKENI